jgi:LPXTG-motif cell wall-anchored protein
MKKIVPGLSALALGVVGVVAFAPVASAATCVPSAGTPAVAPTSTEVLVTPGTPGSPAVTHNETRFVRTVIDVPGKPAVDPVYRTDEKWSRSTFIEGWTNTNETRIVVLVPGVDAVTHEEYRFQRTVIDQPYVPGIPAIPAVPDRTEERLVTPAYDETVVVTPAWDEQVLVSEAVPAVPAVTHVEYLYKHFVTGKTQWSKVPLGWGWIEIDCKTVVDVPAVPAKPAVYKTVHHEAVTKVVHHDAVYETVTIPGTPEVPAVPEIPEESHVETTDWVLTAPEGGGWEQIDQRTVTDVEAIPAVTRTEYRHTREVLVTPGEDAVEEISHEESVWVPEEEDAPEGYTATEDVRTVVDQPAIEGTEDVYETVTTPGSLGTPAVVCSPSDISVVTTAEKTATRAATPQSEDTETLAETGSDMAPLYVAGGLLALGGALMATRRRISSHNEG